MRRVYFSAVRHLVEEADERITLGLKERATTFDEIRPLPAARGLTEQTRIHLDQNLV